MRLDTSLFEIGNLIPVLLNSCYRLSNYYRYSNNIDIRIRGLFCVSLCTKYLRYSVHCNTGIRCTREVSYFAINSLSSLIMPVSIFRENNKRVCIDINTNALPVMVLMVFQRYILRVECHCRLAKQQINLNIYRYYYC